MTDAYYSNEKVFIVKLFNDYGSNDLYHLAHFRQNFSETELGKIAYQLLIQLKELHSQNLVYKYLTPHQIIVTEGLAMFDPSIKLQIINIAAMQLAGLKTYCNFSE